MFATQISATLELELLEPRHARELFNVIDANRGYLREFMHWVDTTTRVESVEEFIRHQVRTLAEHGLPTCAIRETGKLVGVIDLHDPRPHIKTASLGYWLAEDAQGRGIMTTACKAILNYAFDLLELNAVRLEMFQANEKSRAIAERLRFQQDGVERRAHALRGEYLDGWVYSMLASEWAVKRHD